MRERVVLHCKGVTASFKALAMSCHDSDGTDMSMCRLQNMCLEGILILHDVWDEAESLYINASNAIYTSL